jgi:hypothetical protein
MYRKAVFALAGAFLAIALIAPPVIFIMQADHDLDNIIIVSNNQGLQTSGNVTITDETNESHQTNIIIVSAIEVVFVVLFAVTLYYGINQPSAEDDLAPEETDSTLTNDKTKST